ncbi:MAG: sigma-70 family RNA polymerase sigma factor [Planctomycetes bacterium]|nr:sigma-70 family RNA polymerase sigma factor [Planctomycetota bacterium]
MPKFYNRDIAELAHQLTLSPRRLRMAQIHGIEFLLELVEEDRAYPFDFVCYRITKYTKRGHGTGALIPGKALISDLVTLAEVISRKTSLSVDELGEPYKTHLQLAEELQVSTKTIRRWRNRGLLGVRVVFEDGVNRLAFCNSTVNRFVVRHRDLVAKGAAFKQLTQSERDAIVNRARELLAHRPLKMQAAARIIAEETGRAVETVRYTLRRFDGSDDGPLFGVGERGELCERYAAIWRCHQAGEAPNSIARAFECSKEDIQSVLRHVQVRKWKEAGLACVSNELFDAPNADALILEVPEPPAAQGSKAKVKFKAPKDTPGYLRSLYLTPLLTPEQERDLFRRYNYLKHRTAATLTQADPDGIDEQAFVSLRSAMARIDEFKQRLISANLRLVVSIAKRHIGWAPNFFEVISDGNVSLMRAVEKFDFSRGVRFSTYASWAIIKNYARSIPEERYRRARQVTGQDELLEAAPDHREVPVCQSDRTQVREMIAAGLNELTDREREIVSGHFGLGQKGTSLTLEQLGKRFGVTKERIRQIERRALDRLRSLLSPSLADVLLD